MPDNDIVRTLRERDNDIKFVRLAFTAPDGSPKNVSVPPGEAVTAMSDGFAFSSEMIDGFPAGAKLIPDPDTFAILPWRPQHGRVARMFCLVAGDDGRPIDADERSKLIESVKKAKTDTRVTISFEFVLLTDMGNPIDFGGYLDIFPLDKGENVRRDIDLYLAEFGVPVRSSNHASGAGRNTITLAESGVVRAADNIQTFKSILDTSAAQHGFSAVFDAIVITPVSAQAQTISPDTNPYRHLINIVK